MRSRDKSLYSSGSHFSQFCPFGSRRFRKLHFSDFFVLIVLHHPAKFEKNLRTNPHTKTWVLLGNNLATFGPKLIIWAKREFLEKFHLMNFIKLLSPVMQQSLEKESVQDILEISMQNFMLISSKSWPLTSHRTFWQTSLKS